MQEFSKRVTQKLSKLSDTQIKQIVDGLYNECEMFDSIFQSISTGLLIISDIDSNFKLIKLNKAAERFLPFSINPEDSKVEKLPIWELFSDIEFSKFLKTHLESKKTNVRNEFTFATSGGTVRFFDIFISPFAHKKKLAGSIVRIEDITEKKNQEILLHRMEAMASLTNIAASVAHEIKNPLGAISIHIQLMQKAIKKKREGDGLLPEPKFSENYLDVINSEIDRLNKIVVNFLMAVRPISVQLELVNPNTLLSEFLDFFKPEFTAKNIEIETNLCSDCPRVLIDSKLFRNVIVNLAQNSLAAIQNKIENSNYDSSLIGKITLFTEIKNDNFILKFSDNGIGMDEKTCARVFEPYFTTKANGTGLGMSMSYKIIKEFSGDITVSSILGEGTQFIIILPIPQMNKRLLTCKTQDGVEK